MTYKPVLYIERKNGKRYFIFNDDSASMGSNLAVNEFIIADLYSKRCPIGQHCIEYIEEDHLNHFCEHFGNLFQITPSQFSPESLFCKKDKMYHEVSGLKAFNCPLGQDDCRECKKLTNIIAKPFPDKSHCYVVCE